MESEIKSLTKTIKQQSGEIKRLNRIIENIEKKQPVKNKDKYTFLQAVNLRCKEKGWLPYWVDTIGGKTPTWLDITTPHVENFVDYLRLAKSKRLNTPIQPTTQNMYIAQLRAVIKWGNTTINDTLSVLRSKKTVQRKKVWLHPDELERLYYYNFKNNEASTWRSFMLCCLIGCRIIDVNNISINNLDGNTLRYTPIKTRDTECYIRLRKNQIEALQRILSVKGYGYTPTNKTLRTMLYNAGIKRTFDIGTYLNREVTTIADVCHFHTARHTFATIKYRYSNYT